VKKPVSVLALLVHVAMAPSVRAQPEFNFDSGGAATGRIGIAAQGLAGNHAAMKDLKTLAITAGLRDLSSQSITRTVPQQRSGGISYAGPSGMLLSGTRVSAVVTPRPGSSAFLAAEGASIDSAKSAGASQYRLPTTPPDGNVHMDSAPKTSTSKSTGSREAITIRIRPPSFLLLLSNVAAVSLLAFAWRRVRR
jgi:hypothetical protein